MVALTGFTALRKKSGKVKKEIPVKFRDISLENQTTEGKLKIFTFICSLMIPSKLLYFDDDTITIFG